MTSAFVIGIDPGTTTGFALWDCQARRLFAVATGSILDVMQWVLFQKDADRLALLIFEDARLTRIGGGESFGKAEKLQGVGSVKRDCAIWEEFCIRHRIPWEARRARKDTKLDAEPFRKLTGWQASTNNHGRDAAMIVHGLNPAMLQCKLITFADGSSRQRTDLPRARPRAGRRSRTL